MRNLKQEGSALCKGMRKGDDKCARILRKNHHGAKAIVPADGGRLAVCASYAPRSLGCTRVFKVHSNFFVVFPPEYFFEFSHFISWNCDSRVPLWNCAVIFLLFFCVCNVLFALFFGIWIFSLRVYYWIGKWYFCM